MSHIELEYIKKHFIPQTAINLSVKIETQPPQRNNNQGKVC